MLWPLLLLAALVSGSNVATECNQQLHNYYVALGVPMATPVQQALIFTTGVFMGTPYVRIENRIQEAARFYDALLPSPPGNLSYVAYLTLDIPWCTTDIGFSCYDNATFGLAKTSNCTTLVDYDQGAPNPIAGRLFLYQNQTTNLCNGSAFITFYNVTLNNATNDTYTYDVRGIQQQLLMPWVESTNVYRASTCEYSDGDPADVVTQAQFVCVEPQMFCAGTRTSGAPSLQAVPIPQFGCIGQTNVNSTLETLLWRVSSLQPIGGISGTYMITFVTDLAFQIAAEVTAAAQGVFYVLVSGTVRQFDSHIDSLQQFALLFYQQQWTNFDPTYAFSADPRIAAVPCACGFSMFCDAQGNADVSSMYNGYVSLNNALPVCNPGPNTLLPFGTAEFNISAELSFDPDGGPYPFNVYWRVLQTPYDPAPPPFNLTDPQQVLQTINSTGLQTGTYLFVLYVSDLQSQVPCVLNITIVPNVVNAIVENDKIVAFTFYSGQSIGHPCSQFPPQPAISLNGSFSYGTDPLAPLYYQWYVYSAGALQVPFFCDPTGFMSTSAFFNDTQAIAWFVPPLPGQYCFRLNVTDNITVASSAILCVTVNPNFEQPNATFTPIANFTAPPIRDFNFTNRTIFSPPPYTLPPFVTLAPIQASPVQSPPPLNTNTTPYIPVWPPATWGERVLLWLVLACVLAFTLLFAYLVILYHEEAFFGKYEKKRYGAAYGYY